MATTLRAVPRVGSPNPAIDSMNAPVRRALLARGVLLEALPGESPVGFGERLDTALMAWFRDTRDAGAFEALYARSRAGVFDWLRRLLAQRRCGLDPFEVLQDTFVNVYRYSGRFRDERPDSFRVWVRTIASNALRRARSQMPRRAEPSDRETRWEPVAPRAEPDRRLDEHEVSRDLAMAWLLFLQLYARAYAGLAARDQAALALVEVEGLSYAEAGERLCVGPSNMKMIMFRARQRLLARMQRALDQVRAAPSVAAPLREAG